MGWSAYLIVGDLNHIETSCREVGKRQYTPNVTIRKELKPHQEMINHNILILTARLPLTIEEG